MSEFYDGLAADYHLVYGDRWDEAVSDGDADVEQALRAMHSMLRPGGLLVISTRDYDAALVDRPATAPASTASAGTPPTTSATTSPS